ncbi:hypothetical protein [Romboutsia lituseburensis]|uniref:hypothetical protein n=1 Tax=Romboutsia lituseburensis TaxID=1537 RepID=UPI00215AA3A3|nr:hypothetical protein [Romboutsia lituseburensis]MCR8744242.1 hypothetical protein [Romboutsia lituseburensis]
MKKIPKKLLIGILALSLCVTVGLGINKKIRKQDTSNKKEEQKKEDKKDSSSKEETKEENNNATEKDTAKEEEELKRKEEEEIKRKQEELRKKDKEKIEATYSKIKKDPNYVNQENGISKIIKARQAIVDEYGNIYDNVMYIKDEKIETIKGDYYVFGINVNGEVSKEELFIVDKNTFKAKKYTNDDIN